MGDRDYRAGMEAGAKPFEEAFHRQAEKIEEVGSQIGQWFDRYGNLIDVILSDLDNKEKLEIYRLQMKTDLADIGKAEQELLICILYTIANHSCNIPAEKKRLQQRFLIGLQNYLSITTPQILNEIVDLEEPIQNIDSKSEERAMFLAVMEYFYLGYGNYIFTGVEQQILTYFQAVATKDFLETVKESIDEQCHAVGPDGIADKYYCLQNASAKEGAQPEEEKKLLSIYVEVPKESQKSKSASMERAAAKRLKIQLTNRRHTCPDWKDEYSDFYVYLAASEGAGDVKAALENDPGSKIFDQFGCAIYWKGRNILLEYGRPQKIDGALREEIVSYYRKCSTRANRKGIVNWTKKHRAKEKKDYLASQIENKIDLFAWKVSSIADDAMAATDSKKIVAAAKRAGGVGLRVVSHVGKTAGKFAAKVGGAIEAGSDQSSVYISNSRFDKEILPDIQCDLLIIKLVELIDDGTIA